jgi:SHS2 domain-containing protein
MKKYVFLPHTADTKIQAFGKTLEEAFENAALALTEVISDPKKIKANIAKKISVESEDEKALLYDFLEQFLILIDTDGFLMNKVTKLDIKKEKNKLKLSAEIIGDTGIQKYNPKTGIKAVTYQEMEIQTEKNKCMVQVVLDL